LADLAEKTSEYMTVSDSTKDASSSKEEPVSAETLPLAPASVGNGREEKNQKSGG